MTARREYFDDLLVDAADAVGDRWGDASPEAQARIVAALITSDSLNGLRKALLQQSASFARTPTRND